MKNRLNITIDETLIDEAKRYAEKNNKSLSQIIEESLKKLVAQGPGKKPNILDLMKQLPKPKGNFKHDSSQTYYEERKGKYGF
ncbi:DUF6364 family protein [Flavisolibacter ginsengisoli]|jgi:hypothetical protein|uniref:Ribbon-helix-helix protein, copG family n=1 Tax=Flavisolibacter ginsengisoli DSM 18119 TaxID=1121884 RepID=A0A1M5FIU1_9BACT|nr:DUF6364 family protein [Flavisolibacter ginsengisoli]SHF91497.1 hypothetical protein SAMN02745131_03845 [Flavisolibacter ginsengisoli DSM 18119]